MAEADRDDLISIIDEEDKTTEIPTTLPLLPVRDVVIFTDMLLPLFVGREKSVRAVEEAVGGPGFVFLATQKDAATENPSTDEIYHTGTVGRVLRILKLPDGRVKVLVQGVAKGTISKFMRKRAPYRVRIDLLPGAARGGEGHARGRSPHAQRARAVGKNSGPARRTDQRRDLHSAERR